MAHLQGCQDWVCKGLRHPHRLCRQCPGGWQTCCLARLLMVALFLFPAPSPERSRVREFPCFWLWCTLGQPQVSSQAGCQGTFFGKPPTESAGSFAGVSASCADSASWTERRAKRGKTRRAFVSGKLVGLGIQTQRLVLVCLRVCACLLACLVACFVVCLFCLLLCLRVCVFVIEKPIHCTLFLVASFEFKGRPI